MTSTVHGLIAPDSIINLNKDDIITLYPNQAFQRSIDLGPIPIKSRTQDDDNGDLKMSHHACVVRIAKLDVGQKYQIVLRSTPFSIYWYEQGNQQDVEKRHRENRTFSVSHITGYDMTPSLELNGETPEIEIIE